MLGRHEIATALVAPGKGILAADESIATMSKRLEAVGVRPGADMRRDYRELLLTTPGLAHWVACMIFSGETLGQELPDGTPFGHGGLVTQRLDGLRSRLGAYRERGATFACANLAAINAQAAAGEPVPWRLTFSFGRALVEDALRAWRGIPAQVAAAQAELAGNCQRASAASSPAATPVRT